MTTKRRQERHNDNEASARETPQTGRPSQVTDPDDGSVVTREVLVEEVMGYVEAELPDYLKLCHDVISDEKRRGNSAQVKYYVFCEDVVKEVIKKRANDKLAPAIAAAAEALNLRRQRKIIQGKAAAEAASLAAARERHHQQKIKWIRAAAIAAAAEAHRRRHRADQRRAIARATAAAATIRHQQQVRAQAPNISADTADSLGNLYRQRPQHTVTTTENQASKTNEHRALIPENTKPQLPQKISIYESGKQEDVVSRVPADEKVEEMMLRMGGGAGRRTRGDIYRREPGAQTFAKTKQLFQR